MHLNMENKTYLAEWLLHAQYVSYHKSWTKRYFVTGLDFSEAKIAGAVIDTRFLPHAPAHVNELWNIIISLMFSPI